jgi:hypothetical protein
MFCPLTLACALAPAAPAPLNPTTYPPPKYVTARTPLDGQPMEWWMFWEGKHFTTPRTSVRVRGCYRVKLSHDGSYRAEPGGWRGKWSWDKKTRTFAVRETTDNRRWRCWRVYISRGPVRMGCLEYDGSHVWVKFEPVEPLDGFDDERGRVPVDR